MQTEPNCRFMFCKCLRCCELPPPGPQNLNADFTREEVEHAIQKLQNGKACGEDQLRNEMFKLGGGIMVTLLLQLFKYINDQGAVADDWRKATVVNLFKDGDPLDPSNYRGISLISCLGKLFLSIWAERITNHTVTSSPTSRVASGRIGPQLIRLSPCMRSCYAGVWRARPRSCTLWTSRRRSTPCGIMVCGSG